MKVLQQGEANGMCGIYAVLNFLRDEWKDQPSDTLWSIFEACRTLGWLTPEYLTQGFEDFQLKKILEWHIDNYRLSYKVYFLADLAEHFRQDNAGGLIKSITAGGGAAITSVSGGKHWVLVRASSDGPIVYDSHKSGMIEPLSKRRLDQGVDWGIGILPDVRQPEQVTN